MTIGNDFAPTVQDIYELSPMQQGMLFHALYEPESDVYVEQRHCLLEGDLNPEAFRQAWQQVIDRYDILRSEFHWEEADRPLQVVYDTVELPWVSEDWRQLSAERQQQQLEAFLLAERLRGFVPDYAPLMRCALFRLGDRQHRFVWNYHHLLMDGWCNGVLIRDVLAIYRTAISFEAVSLPPVKPYREYILWLQQQDSDRAEAYWRSVLKGFDAPTPLGITTGVSGVGNRVVNSVGTELDNSKELARKGLDYRESSYKEQQYFIPADFSQMLTAFAKQARLTLNTLVQGAWATVLSRYSGLEEVLFGITVSGRPPELSGVESMVGLFINTVPLRVRLSRSTDILPWLRQIQTAQRERETYSYSNLSDLQSWSNIPKGTALFESLLIFENYPLSIEAVTQSLNVGFSLRDGQGYEKTNYPLTLVIIPGKSIRFSARYDAQRFSDAAIDRLLNHITEALKSFVEDPHQKLSQVSILTAAEKDQLGQFAQGRAVEIANRCVHQQFEDQAITTPKAIALTFSNDQSSNADNSTTLTYQQLNHRANQIAHYLSGHGIRRGVRVGICLERSADMVASLLAVLKLGGTYVPLDPTHPQERLGYIVEQAQIEALITTADVCEVRSLYSCPLIICLDSKADEISSQAVENIDSSDTYAVTGDDTAYILYTSGSTGKPKGVPITHRSLTNFLASMAKTCRISRQDKLLAVTTLGFDIAALEIFLPLVSGAQVVITPQEITADGERLSQQIERHNITIMQATPTAWRLLLDANWQGQPSLTMLCGGEALDAELAKRLLPCGESLFNLYGPTETTIWSGALRVDANILEQPNYFGSVPIGTPIDNTQFYVLDQEQHQVPVGVAGELYIGGAGLSAGYWRRPDLTAERFVTVHVAGVSQRLYRTGDRVRYREDGTLDFLGRLDTQVKLRGFRIELGAIETALAEHPEVAQAVVTIQSDQAQLLAYIKPAVKPAVELGEKSGKASTTLIEDLQQWLKRSLPNYMLPSGYKIVEAFPLTPNGKVDRRSLPTFTPVAVQNQPPRTQSQQLVSGIWSDILGVENIGLNDSFFELGGHSLLATQAISQIRRIFNVEVPLRSLFENPRLQDFVTVVEQAQNSAAQPADDEIVHINAHTNAAVLSFAQQRQWLMHQLAPSSPAYNIPIAIRIRGPLSIQGLEQSIAQVISRHETLRTIYSSKGDTAIPTVFPASTTFAIERVDLEGLDSEWLDPKAQRAEISRATRQQAQQPFDLEKGPLLRSQLLRLNQQEHILLLTQHHIITDGWSIGILQKEIVTLYHAYQAGRELSGVLPPLPITYRDYAAWQRSLDLSAQVAYWKQQLSGLAPLLALPTDYPRPAEPSGAGASYEFRLSKQETEALQQFGQQQQVTLYMTLLAAFNILLYRYSQVTDLAIGTPIANRQRPELEGLIGLFVNTLVIRTSLVNDPKVSDLLAQIRSVALEAYAHQDLPFEKLIDELEIPRSRSHTPLVQVMFALQNDSLLQRSSRPIEQTSDEAELNEALNWSPLSVESERAKFDLTLDIQETDRGLVGEFEYRTDLFSPETIHRMAGHFRNLLRALPHSEGQTISDLSMLARSEIKQLQVWQQGEAFGPLSDQAIHQHFERQVAATPEAVALVCGQTRLSYAELNQKANQLARDLQRRGVQLETAVGVWAVRSPDTIITILAILKAGGTYVPLDPSYPIERLKWMVTDTGLSLLVANSSIASVPAEISALVTLIALDAETNQLSSLPETNLSLPDFSPAAIAYILYTSGSTGQPKGVCVSHQSVTRLVIDPNYVTLISDDVLLQAAPLTFDASTFEIWGALLNGGRLVLLDEQSPSLETLGQTISTQEVTTLWLTSGLFNLMVDEQLHTLTSVRQLLAGGDVLSPYHLSKALKFLENTQIINGYGPTEGTTFTCCHTITQFDLDSTVPIGRPLSHTQTYVLDADLQRVPVGIPGELYIGGAGVARGYLNQAALTAQKFVPNPFYSIRQQSESDSLYLYKTGDRVRYRSDGALEYLGRLDKQVKIRGFRIEPSEIETVLESHADIQQAAVVTHGDSAEQKRLVAYIETKREEAEPDIDTITPLELRQFLLAKLPDYMVPAKFVWMSALPLTANGKVDRRALPVPDWTVSEAERAPRTEVEAQLIDIFSSLLPAQTIGPHDNFFELGGDSIIAMQIVSRASKAGIKISPKQLFQYQTVAELAAVADQGGYIPIAQAPAEGEVPLTPIQHWFFKQDLAQPHHFNQSVYLSLPIDLDKAALERAIAQVFTHHDAFRLRFSQAEHGWRQAFSSAVAPSIQWFDCIHLSDEEQTIAIAEQIDRAQTCLNVHDGPLVSICGFDFGSDSPSHLFIVIHHLVIDGVSWRILLADVQQAYAQAIAHQPIELQSKTHSFQQWSHELQESANSPEIVADWDYWHELSSHHSTGLPCDFDSSAAENTIENSSNITVHLSKERTQQLLKEVPTAYDIRIMDALLTVYAQTMTAWTNDALLVDIESYGRFSDTLDLSRTVGWFTALYPVLLSFNVEQALRDNLRATQQKLAALPNNGLSYGLLRYLSLNSDRSKLHTSAPVSFNYLGQIDADKTDVDKRDNQAERFTKVSLPNGLESQNQAGKNLRAHLLDINSWIEKGQLSVEWTFSQRHHQQETIARLAEEFIHNLSVLVDSSLASESEAYGPSDFGLVDFDSAAITAVLDQVSFAADPAEQEVSP